MSASVPAACRGWGRESVSVTGKLLPWGPLGAVLINLPGAPLPAVPIFDHAEDLRVCMTLAGIRDYTIKQIDDGADFLRSVEEGGAIVAKNPRLTHEGTTRWTWVMLDTSGAAEGVQP